MYFLGPKTSDFIGCSSSYSWWIRRNYPGTSCWRFPKFSIAFTIEQTCNQIDSEIFLMSFSINSFGCFLFFLFKPPLCLLFEGKGKVQGYDPHVRNFFVFFFENSHHFTLTITRASFLVCTLKDFRNVYNLICEN